ncbi:MULTISPECIES: DUF4190 domain-containing protein [unclassified Streptomyces]|uniref:DUF4190 domain-containing protein n=1 Tax=unclassified Streptomyces TaxID=2593676 RepID=UPI0006F4EDC0|nr:MULTISPECIES: DUF4190 domain-containing protein [unclassified Streptomyces]KQX53221.1 hypothetical protein ASD33_08470 [Streptomyces sp. Root1304]KRA90142.1 hypothetical protein ASE09_08475 [Streptomyces sp. Root66D1]
MTTPTDKPEPNPWAPPQPGEADAPVGSGASAASGTSAASDPSTASVTSAASGTGDGLGTADGLGKHATAGMPGHPGMPGQPGPPGMPPYGMPPARSGLGVGALVIGIVGLLFGIVPFLFWLGGIMGVLALVLGIVGHGRAGRGEATDRGQAVAGIVLGAVTIVVSAAWLVLFLLAANTVSDTNDSVLEIESSAPAPRGTRSAPAPEPTETAPAVRAFGETYTYGDGVKVTVSAPRPYTPDRFAAGYEKGDTTVRLTITIVNGSDRTIDVTTALPGARDAEGATAGTVFDGSRGTEMFRGKVLPGKQAKAGYVFALPAGADGEMQLELAPQLAKYDSVIWTGPVKQ